MWDFFTLGFFVGGGVFGGVVGWFGWVCVLFEF